MYPLFISDEIGTLSYDSKKDVVLRNEVEDPNYSPVFVPNGDNSPDFFGYLDKKTNKVHDIYHGVSNIVDENKISLS